MHDDTDTNFFPGIEEFLNENDQGSDINLKDLDELIYTVRSKTALSYEQCEIIIKEIFTNIRNELLKENSVIIKNIGGFYISKKNRVQYYTTKSIKDKLNGK